QEQVRPGRGAGEANDEVGVADADRRGPFAGLDEEMLPPLGGPGAGQKLERDLLLRAREDLNLPVLPLDDRGVPAVEAAGALHRGVLRRLAARHRHPDRGPLAAAGGRERQPFLLSVERLRLRDRQPELALRVREDGREGAAGAVSLEAEPRSLRQARERVTVREPLEAGPRIERRVDPRRDLQAVDLRDGLARIQAHLETAERVDATLAESSLRHRARALAHVSRRLVAALVPPAGPSVRVAVGKRVLLAFV